MIQNNESVVSTNKVTSILFSLSETDREIQSLIEQKLDIEERRAVLLADLTRAKERLEQLDGLYREGASKHALEEHRLKDEEQKIVERRKQLTAIGGAKSAKLMERELDIATRVLQTMEQNAIQTMEEIEGIKSQLAAAQALSESSEKEFEELTQETDDTLKTLEKNITKLDSAREKQLAKIDQRLKNLYRKVNTRYPGEAIALAKSGACRSCFRALPAQLYNQVMAGNMLIQCPGCSRIMVFSESVNGK